MIDIRKEIEKTLAKYGHDIVYVRSDKKFRCECFVERSGEPRPDCSICFGTGYVVELEKKKTRRKIASVPETLIGLNKIHPSGSVVPKAYVYYFKYFESPKEDDLILEVIWDKKGIPRHIKNKYRISVVDEQLGDSGRVEFYQVYCRFDQKGDHDDTALTKH